MKEIWRSWSSGSIRISVKLTSQSEHDLSQEQPRGGCEVGRLPSRTVDHQTVGIEKKVFDDDRLGLAGPEQLVQGGQHRWLLRAADLAGSLREFRVLCAGAAHDLRCRGADSEMIERAIQEALQCCAEAIHGYPLDMVVEARLRAELPLLRPVQFLSQRHFMPMPDRLDLNPRLRRILPRPMLQAVEAVSGAYYISIDHLHHGATQFAARYQRRPTFGLMQELFARWQARFPRLGPGGHFELVDEFAERLGLKGLCQWLYFPATPALVAGIEACATGETTRRTMPIPSSKLGDWPWPTHPLTNA